MKRKILAVLGLVGISTVALVGCKTNVDKKAKSTTNENTENNTKNSKEINSTEETTLKDEYNPSTEEVVDVYGPFEIFENDPDEEETDGSNIETAKETDEEESNIESQVETTADSYVPNDDDISCVYGPPEDFR